ncbi:MAG TPA: sensor histidine kinase [Desulfuromonadales bacterium]|nr:sensor histidine kinase [Desulfuromonadales bacterium]
MKLILALLQQMSVFLVFAYLFTKSPAFRPLTSDSLRPRQKFLLYFVFSVFSILGTYFGLPVKGAIANTRAIGAVLAGLIGGPFLGAAVGFTGGLHRYFLGGFTAVACGVSTTMEGLFGGLFHLFLQRTGHSEQIFSPKIAFAVTFYAEMMQMAIILLLARPFSSALDLVEAIALPMLLANATGAALFISIMRDQKNMYDKFGAIFSAKALKVAERTLGILTRGFSRETAQQIAHIIHDETGVGAVAITNRDTVLAFIGIGEEHHQVGLPIASQLTKRAIQENKVIYADGVSERFHCPRSPSCPLGSALVAPLRVDNEVIGTIKLYEPRHRIFLNMNRTLGEGIASLLSDQLLHSRYEEQKNLLIKSELKLTQAQINPHFLFNALTTIIAVIRKDADQARDLLLHLSNFFRKNLKRSNDMATLEEELDHVRSYLKIEEARFEDRLSVHMALDPDLFPIKIPTFTLQPIIENAIKHGISNMLDQGVITLSARVEDQQLLITVQDNAGTYCPDTECGGLGMSLVDKRIKNLCGPKYGVEVFCVPEEQTSITIKIPREGCS